MTSLGVSFDAVYTDNWESFNAAFLRTIIFPEKKILLALSGITANCDIVSGERLEKPIAFLKNYTIHMKIFNLAFFYINFGYV